jgi:hypothetical protein
MFSTLNLIITIYSIRQPLQSLATRSSHTPTEYNAFPNCAKIKQTVILVEIPEYLGSTPPTIQFFPGENATDQMTPTLNF